MGWRWGKPPPPPCGQTHTCENSTFPYAGGKNISFNSSEAIYLKLFEDQNARINVIKSHNAKWYEKCQFGKSPKRSIYPSQNKFTITFFLEQKGFR